MALFEIDDRDTVNNYYEMADKIAAVPATKYKEWMGRLKAENPKAVINHLGSGIFKLDLEAITCTGADVTTRFNIPFMHDMKKMEIKHTDSAKADSVNALSYTVNHRHHPNLWLLLLNVTATTASDIIDEYIEYYMQSGEYKLVTNTTNTEKLYISVYINIKGV